MEIALGIRVKDGVILATSKAFTRGISVLKATDDKTRMLNDYNVLAFTGESGDTTQFAEYIQANIQLYTMREGSELNSKAIASYIRHELAKSLRTRKPYQVNVMLAGLDKGEEPFLSMIDYMGTRVDLPYAAHGYAAFYTMSLLDRHYKPDMNVQDGMKLLDMCEAELAKRFPVEFKGLLVKVVDKKGIRNVRGDTKVDDPEQ
ncbi:Proteasome subunit beta type-4 [Brettanomyces nanus]|uniref:Proteasome subunit beta n=1 Tax=Eeniella nana TaxID=13502 RepID=A0A875RXR2_EENNA|nr:Proteasome subunit beta type-4 [Brettanomyces nanus]QPG74271.1 Proteasome subunit beta type-4 [Brettanomyces nanus]